MSQYNLFPSLLLNWFIYGIHILYIKSMDGIAFTIDACLYVPMDNVSI